VAAALPSQPPRASYFASQCQLDGGGTQRPPLRQDSREPPFQQARALGGEQTPWRVAHTSASERRRQRVEVCSPAPPAVASCRGSSRQHTQRRAAKTQHLRHTPEHKHPVPTVLVPSQRTILILRAAAKARCNALVASRASFRIRHSTDRDRCDVSLSPSPARRQSHWHGPRGIGS
jgi:hypothetical protein